jgi:hypothetical protein
MGVSMSTTAGYIVTAAGIAAVAWFASSYIEDNGRTQYSVETLDEKGLSKFPPKPLLHDTRQQLRELLRSVERIHEARWRQLYGYAAWIHSAKKALEDCDQSKSEVERLNQDVKNFDLVEKEFWERFEIARKDALRVEAITQLETWLKERKTNERSFLSKKDRALDMIRQTEVGTETNRGRVKGISQKIDRDIVDLKTAKKFINDHNTRPQKDSPGETHAKAVFESLVAAAGIQGARAIQTKLKEFKRVPYGCALTEELSDVVEDFRICHAAMVARPLFQKAILGNVPAGTKKDVIDQVLQKWDLGGDPGSVDLNNQSSMQIFLKKLQIKRESLRSLRLECAILQEGKLLNPTGMNLLSEKTILLSRMCRSLDQADVLNRDPFSVHCHPEVVTAPGSGPGADAAGQDVFIDRLINDQ